MTTISIVPRSFRKCGFAVWLLAFAALAMISLGTAHAEYPDHQITIVSCFPAGGGTDLAVRMINVQLGNELGQPIIIENRGGAGGSIGTAFVARAPADGYTLLACSSAFVVNPILYRMLPMIRSKTLLRS